MLTLHPRRGFFACRIGRCAVISARREKLPTIFERYRSKVQRELKSSFEAMISQLRRDLPAMAKQQPLESAKKTGAGLRPNVVEDECRKICNKIIEERVQAWSSAPPTEPGARQSIQPVLDPFQLSYGSRLGRLLHRLHMRM